MAATAKVPQPRLQDVVRSNTEKGQAQDCGFNLLEVRYLTSSRSISGSGAASAPTPGSFTTRSMPQHLQNRLQGAERVPDMTAFFDAAADGSVSESWPQYRPRQSKPLDVKCVSFNRKAHVSGSGMICSSSASGAIASSLTTASARCCSRTAKSGSKRSAQVDQSDRQWNRCG